MQNVNQHKHGNCASRRRILDWINNNLGTTHVRLEELRSGAEYCQLLHKLQPSAIRLKKVIKDPKSQYECVQNMKLLQKSLCKQGVQKQIPIQRLVSRGNIESLEFAQWFKAFYDHNYQLLRPEKTEDSPKTLEIFHEKPDSFVDTGKGSYDRLESTASSQSEKNLEINQEKKTIKSDEEQVSLIPELDSSPDELSLHPLEGSSQSTYELIPKNALPIDVIDFQEQNSQRSQSNNCNSEDITMAGESSGSTEIDIMKIEPEEGNRCKDSNGPLLGKYLDGPLPWCRPFKLRRTFDFHEVKSVKIKKLVDGSAPISSEEECSSDDFNKDMEAKIVSIWKDIHNVIKALQRIEQNWYRNKINERRTTFKH
ncbi:GD23272 [Drosophila simulans]|uniref:GD23272 n=1 Tax=Drosophila simulans TaxID=7240 RepID=B4QA50_DROSI|nr:GD23272 [Drosophila simulans]